VIIKTAYMNFKIAVKAMALLSIIFLACGDDEKKNNTLPPPPVVSASWSENFTDVANLGRRGWIIVNNTSGYRSVF